MRDYRHLILCSDDYSRYTEGYFMKANSQAPGKFKEYAAKVEKQHPKSKKSRGGGEPGREKILEYLVEQDITREEFTPYSLQQSGFSERCNHTVMYLARSML